jgi:hypothetical protein
MSVHYFIPEKRLLKVAQVFNWFTKEQVIMWFFEDQVRSRRVEILLPRTVKKEKLIEGKYGKKKVYIVPRLGRSPEPQIEHGLGVTEGLVRFWVSDKSGEIIPSRKFEKCGVRPEWGLKYKDKVFLYEFCTQDNARRIGVLKKKINAYSTMGYLVVFVMDISRDEVSEKIGQLHPEGRFMFTDYETFKSVSIGKQFTAPIYIWGEDKNVYPLRYEPDN